MKGGSRVNSGRPQEPDALRRDRHPADWTILPERREGPAPPWPLIRPSKRESVIWKQEWTRGQAVIWAHGRHELEVALMVRTLVEAEKRNATVAIRTLLRQQMDALGLTQPGLRALRWRIGPAAESETPARPRRTRSAKARFEVIDGDAARSVELTGHE